MDDKIKEICHVTVMVREIQKKQLSVTNMLLKVGDTKKISAYASPESPVNRKIIYKSSNVAIATVDDSGNIKAIQEGEIDIIVTDEKGKVEARCKVTVYAPVENVKKSVEKVVLDKTSMELTVGKTTSLKATITPTDADNKKVIWTSSNPDVVVADHGETTNGHGGNTKEERSAFLGIAGHYVNKMVLGAGYRNRDVSAIALRALGVSKHSHFIAGVPSGLFK